MPTGVIASELKESDRGGWPGPLRRVRVRLRSDKLDRALAGGADPGESVDLSMRARQLAGEEERERIAGTIDAILGLIDRGKPVYGGFSRIPLDRERIRANRAGLERLAGILRGTEPVSPRGVAMARQLTTDFRGPIYTGGRNSRLPDTLASTLSALER
jgi:hypothetical protein